MRWLPALMLAACVGGCSALPGGGELPSVADLRVTVTAGPHTTSAVTRQVVVEPGDEVQLQMRLAQGEQVEVSAPETPATEVVVTATGDDGSRAEITLRAANGRAFRLARPSEFTPGHVGVEFLDGREHPRVELTAPRITGQPQGQFDFKMQLRVV